MKPGPKPRPTVKLIAAKAGLSGAAVSLALRDHPSIPPATRARIKRLADQLGYRVDLIGFFMVHDTKPDRVLYVNLGQDGTMIDLASITLGE